MYLPTLKKDSSVLQVETIGPAEVQAGSPFDVETRVTNLTDVTLYDVAVVYDMRSDMNFRMLDSSPKMEMDTNNQPRWAVGELGPRQTKVAQIRGVAGASGCLWVCMDATYRLPPGCLTLAAVQPALQLTKTGPLEALACDQITWCVRVANVGNGPARNVKVQDTLPDGLTTTDGKTAVSFDAGTLEPGQAKQFNIPIKPTKPGTYTNTVTATAEGGMTASASARIVIRQPVLQVTKTGPATRYVGSNIIYQITVTNKGDAEARDTVLTDVLFPGTAYCSSSMNGQFANGKVTWALGTLPPGASRTVTLEIRADQPCTVRNRAEACAYCAAGAGTTVSNEVVTQVLAVQGIHMELIDNPDPAGIGDNVTYTITVIKQGPEPGKDIRITAFIPAQGDFVSATGPTKYTMEGKRVFFEPVPVMPDKLTYTVVVKVRQIGDARFGATMTTDRLKTPVEDEEATNYYDPRQPAVAAPRAATTTARPAAPAAPAAPAPTE